MDLLVGSRTMLNSTGHDDEFTFVEGFHSVPELHFERTPNDKKKLVLQIVSVPDEFTLELGQPDMLAVELADDSRIPVIGEERELFADVDLIYLLIR